MPARTVGFAPIPATYSRLPHDDEAYVLRAFAKHSAHCPACSSPYQTHLAGHTLCPKGTQRALDVTQYVFAGKGGSVLWSVVDLERGERVQIEIPSDCLVVRGLLKAMERGMRLRASHSSLKPISTTSYQSHHVPSSRSRDLGADLSRLDASSPESELDAPYTYQTIAPKKSSKHHHHVSGKHDRVPSKAPKYYTVGSKGALPVPRGGDWYY